MAQAECCRPSVLMTVQTVTVYPKAATLNSIMLHPAAAAATLTVYDNASAASGTILAVLNAASNGVSIVFPFDGAPVMCLNGITCIVTGVGAQAQVYYQPEN